MSVPGRNALPEHLAETQQAPDNALITLIRGTQVGILAPATTRALALLLIPKLKAIYVLQ